MRKLLLFFTSLLLTCAAAPPAAEQQANYLQVVLQQADEAYHNRHQSLMSDAAYDALRNQYDRLVAQYPELVTKPLVGAPVSEAGNRILHTAPILSLQKAYSNEEVEAFLEKCGTNRLYCIEPKIDGLTVVLRYRNGLLVQAITRGDGKTGMDVTAPILASGAVPSKLLNAPTWLEVRGEVFISIPAFDALNQRRIETGQSLLKSPRNTAAGTLRLKDYAEIANRNLSIQIFDLIETSPMPATHTEALALINSVGLTTLESRTVTTAHMQSAIDALNQKRTHFPFQTDGVVIRVDDRILFNRLGSTAHHPHGALARKYKEPPMETRLLSVTWTHGKTGRRTPIGHFDPIKVQGATLQKASLHNLAYIRALDLRIGDWIHVIRAGGSVPEITGICPGRRSGSEVPIPDP